MRLFNSRIKKNSADEGDLFHLKFNFREKTIVLLLFLSASVAIFFSAAIIYTLIDGSIEFFSEVSIIEFLTGTEWVPTDNVGKFGVFRLLSGTILIAGGAVAIGAPLGVAAAIYLSEFAGNRLRSIVKPIIEILAGIPSIVYGFFALMFISPIFRDVFGASYFNALSAIIVIAIMIMPIIISISDDSMKAVPNHLRETSLALGTTKWETSTKIVMPAASSGIIASILLGLARALGETMIVVLAAGSIARLTFNPLDETMTMSAFIAKVATGDIPPGLAVAGGFAVGLLLFIITYFVNTIASRVVVQIKTGTSVKSKEKKKKNKLTKLIRKVLEKIKSASSNLSKKLREMRYKILKPKPQTLERRYLKQKIGVTIIGGSILIAVIFLILLLGQVISEGIGGLSPTFFTSYPSYKIDKVGIYPIIMGSLYLMGLTILFSAPLGVGAAVYLNEFAKDTRYTRFLRRIIQNLAGVPSIVFGLMGLTIFVRIFGFGPSLLSGSLILTIMSLPIIVVSTEEALKGVPDGFREAALGVGSTRWQSVRHHVLPNAAPGIFTGIILSISRAIGETAPILFIVSFFSKSAPNSIFDGFMALPVQIFYWTTHPNSTCMLLVRLLCY